MTWTPPPNGSAITPLPAATEPPAGGRSRLRWGIALVVTALVVAAVAVAIILTSGRSAQSALAGHVPIENVLMYGEVRLDLPGDQRQKLGDFLSKFPGFADQSTLDLKLDDAMDRVLDAMTQGSQSWSRDIKPWFDGQLALAVGDLPQPGSGGPPRSVLIAKVKDGALAQAWVDGVVAGQTTSRAEYNGATLTIIEGLSERSAVGIIRGEVLVAGSQAAVEASVDVAGKAGFATNERFIEARGALQGDDLGVFYLDLRHLVDYFTASVEGSGAGQFELSQFVDLPDWVSARLRAESDAIVFEAVNPHVQPLAPLENRASRITPNLPPGTIAVFDAHELGNQAQGIIGRLQSNPLMAAGLAEMQASLELIFGPGGLESLLGWMDDVGFAVTRAGDVIDGGLIITTGDRAAAEALMNRLSGFVALSGLPGASIREEVHGTTTIQIVDLGDWQDLSIFLGATPLTGRAELAYAVTDGYVVFGSGTGFVKQVLDAGPGPSLADDARFQGLLGKVGADNTGATFVDLTAFRELAEAQLATDPAALAAYERDVKPFLEPLDAIVHASSVGGAVDRLILSFVVK
jgi:hypothetical protein